jgi:hypothetical protein
MKPFRMTLQFLTTNSLLARRRLLLLAVLALGLGWLNWHTSMDPGVVNAVVRSTAPLTPKDTASFPASPTTISLNALPRQQDRPLLEIGEVDPFVAEIPKPVQRVKAPPPPPVIAIVAPPPPEPPPLNLLYAGRMTTPEGNSIVYASMGETSIVLIPGLDLPNGYKVTKITERVVEFSYPALNRTARLDIPAPQEYETR